VAEYQAAVTPTAAAAGAFNKQRRATY
jgi:hypothetical protein